MLLVNRVANDENDGTHNDALIERIPCLYFQGIEVANEIFVVKRAHCTHYSGCKTQPKPLAAFERESLLFAYATYEKK